MHGHRPLVAGVRLASSVTLRPEWFWQVRLPGLHSYPVASGAVAQGVVWYSSLRNACLDTGYCLYDCRYLLREGELGS